jgi:hypothetical protein
MYGDFMIGFYGWKEVHFHSRRLTRSEVFRGGVSEFRLWLEDQAHVDVSPIVSDDRDDGGRRLAGIKIVTTIKSKGGGRTCIAVVIPEKDISLLSVVLEAARRSAHES